MAMVVFVCSFKLLGLDAVRLSTQFASKAKVALPPLLCLLWIRAARKMVLDAGQPPPDAFSTPTVERLDLTKYTALAAAELRADQGGSFWAWTMMRLPQKRSSLRMFDSKKLGSNP